MLPRFLFFFDSKVEKGLLRQMLYLQNQWMDFKNLNVVWKLKRQFCFQFEFFFYFDFQMHKTHPRGFVFENLFIKDYSSTFHLFDDKV